MPLNIAAAHVCGEQDAQRVENLSVENLSVDIQVPRGLLGGGQIKAIV